jgi:hypothetical protein
MSTDPQVETERCLSRELRIDRDEDGRVVSAKAGTGALVVDWQAGTARFGNQYGSSWWSAGIANHDYSYGTWEQSTSEPSSLDAFVEKTLGFLREEPGLETTKRGKPKNA